MPHWSFIINSFANSTVAMDCSVEDSATRGSKRPISEELAVTASWSAQAEAVDTKRPKLSSDEDTVEPKRIDGEAAPAAAG